MSTELREEIDHARVGYQRLTYDGDLAAELLKRRRISIGWAMPLIGSAIAAMVMVAIWQHRPAPAPENKTLVKKIVPATQPNSRGLLAITDIHYEIYVRDVHTGVKQAVHSLTGTVDIALTAPVVTQSVRKVGEVTDDLKEIASNTWSQVRAGPKPPC
jgi:hypothetical protein